MTTIRPFNEGDTAALSRIHQDNGLPATCLPIFTDPLFVVAQVVELDSKLAMGAFIRLTGEAYLLLSHDVGTAEERWQALKALCDTVETSARLKGLTDFSCWIPPEVAGSFGKRLKELGYIQSPWVCFSKIL